MFTIIQDSRENLPYTFQCITPPPVVEVATLQTGDYSIKGFEHLFVVERKSLSDAFNTFGQGRIRWQRELGRMLSFQYVAVIIEADWHSIVKRPPARSRLNPKTVVASIAAWSVRYPNVHFWTCPNREFAERFTFRLLERFWKDRQKEIAIAELHSHQFPYQSVSR